MTTVIIPASGSGAVDSVSDTNSIDLSVSFLKDLTADLKLSVAAASAGSQLVDLTVVSDGLHAQVTNAHIQSAISVSDSNSIDLTYTGGAMTGDVLLSAHAADAANKIVALNIETDGIRAQIADANIQAAISILDTSSIDLSYTLGVISGVLKLSAVVADAGNKLVALDLQSDGLRAQISDTNIQAAISVTDSTSIDFSYGSGVISGVVILSGASASANNQLVTLSLQADGVKAEITDARIRTPFSGTAPVSYVAGTGVISMAAATGAVDGYLTSTNFNTFNGKSDAITIASLGAGDAKGLSVSGAALTLHAATATQPGAVSITTQTLAGAKTFSGDTFKSVSTTNGSFASMMAPSGTAATPTNGQSCSALFNGGFGYMFVVSLSTGESIMCHASYALGTVTAVSDPSNIFLASDAGTGIYISKSATAATISFKNRMGSSRDVYITAMNNNLTSVTAWS